MRLRATCGVGLMTLGVFACYGAPDPQHTTPGSGSAAGQGTMASAGASAGSSSSVDASGRGGSSGNGPGGEAGVGAVAGAAGAVAGAAGAAGAGGADDAGCGAAALDGLEIYSADMWDPLGYPPYALDGCTLVYVVATSGADNGALRLRDLSTGTELTLEAGAAHPRRPTVAVAGAVVAWESDGADGPQVRLRDASGSEPFEKAFAQAGEPRVTQDALVFTAFLGAAATADTDVDLYDLGNHVLTHVATGPGQQRFADVSATHVAVTDFSEDPKGYFDQTGSVSDIVVIDRATLTRTVRAAPGKQAFPLLGSDGLLAYLEWGAVHPEPKFSQFFLKAGYVDALVADDRNVKGGDAQVSTDPAYVRPSLHGVYLDYIDKTATTVQLFRASLDEPAPPVSAAISGASRLLGPVATDELTLVAKPLQGNTLRLVAVAR
jgi:hypothetical protein